MLHSIEEENFPLFQQRIKTNPQELTLDLCKTLYRGALTEHLTLVEFTLRTTTTGYGCSLHDFILAVDTPIVGGLVSIERLARYIDRLIQLNRVRLMTLPTIMCLVKNLILDVVEPNEAAISIIRELFYGMLLSRHWADDVQTIILQYCQLDKNWKPLVDILGETGLLGWNDNVALIGLDANEATRPILEYILHIAYHKMPSRPEHLALRKSMLILKMLPTNLVSLLNGLVGPSSSKYDLSLQERLFCTDLDNRREQIVDSIFMRRIMETKDTDPLIFLEACSSALRREDLELCKIAGDRLKSSYTFNNYLVELALGFDCENYICSDHNLFNHHSTLLDHSLTLFVNYHLEINIQEIDLHLRGLSDLIDMEFPAFRHRFRQEIYRRLTLNEDPLLREIIDNSLSEQVASCETVEHYTKLFTDLLQYEVYIGPRVLRMLITLYCSGPDFKEDPQLISLLERHIPRSENYLKFFVENILTEFSMFNWTSQAVTRHNLKLMISINIPVVSKLFYFKNEEFVVGSRRFLTTIRETHLCYIDESSERYWKCTACNTKLSDPTQIFVSIDQFNAYYCQKCSTPGKIIRASCAVCLDDADDLQMVVSACGHAFCHDCLEKLTIATEQQSSCPMCRKILSSPGVTAITVEEATQFFMSEWRGLG